ncbi:hypothetical protein [Winogradskyella vincentii]|uniref:YD repeat-containing protein n=1 Tax=Winogradskyella vincentii TaxID=2877122 RepID=A0ABS7Y0T0_9FLAO|nr:hypothetical protein [Winogradskyella vincentii]MCA0153487.1 hypothetical protein [Winogradskyella vincentii]
MEMKISKLLLAISILFISLQSRAQLNIVVSKSDSIKSLAFKVFKVKTKNDKVIKSKPTILYDYYPIQYPLAKLYYNKHGLLIKKDNSNQKDTTYYNSKNQIIKKILYPDPARSKDSIIIYYSYDIQGNIETKKMKASEPKLNYVLDSNYYAYESLIDKVYNNYYLLENDSTGLNQFKSCKLELNNYYRLYNGKNKLVEEKYLINSINPFPYKPDSIIHSIKYQYNKENKISKVTNINNYINSLHKNYTSISTEQHKYLSDGLIHDIEYFNEGNLSRKGRIVKNIDGILTKYTNRWISPNRTTTYEYNSKGELKRYTFSKKNKIVRNITLEYTSNSRGHWIKCIHFDKKNKPNYLIERIIEYY